MRGTCGNRGASQAAEPLYQAGPRKSDDDESDAHGKMCNKEQQQVSSSFEESTCSLETTDGFEATEQTMAPLNAAPSSAAVTLSQLELQTMMDLFGSRFLELQHNLTSNMADMRLNISVFSSRFEAVEEDIRNLRLSGLMVERVRL